MTPDTLNQLVAAFKSRIIENFSLASDLLLSDDDIKARLVLALEQDIALDDVALVLSLSLSTPDPSENFKQSENSYQQCPRCQSLMVEFVTTETIGEHHRSIIDLLCLDESTVITFHDNGELICWQKDENNAWTSSCLNQFLGTNTELATGRLQALGKDRLLVSIQLNVSNQVYAEVYTQPWLPYRPERIIKGCKFFIQVINSKTLLTVGSTTINPIPPRSEDLHLALIDIDGPRKVYKSIDCDVESRINKVNCLVLPSGVIILQVQDTLYELILTPESRLEAEKIFRPSNFPYLHHTLKLLYFPVQKSGILIFDQPNDDPQLDPGCYDIYRLNQDAAGNWLSSLIFAAVSEELINFFPQRYFMLSKEMLLCGGSGYLHLYCNPVGSEEFLLPADSFTTPAIAGMTEVFYPLSLTKIAFATADHQIKIGEFIATQCHCS